MLDGVRGRHRRRHAVSGYQNWCEKTQDLLAERPNWVEQHISRKREQGLDYGIEL